MTLSIVRVGRFSGSGTSLRDVLASKTDIIDFDLLTVARKPLLWSARALALAEAIRRRDQVPFAKTASWSKGLQRALPDKALEHPVLFIQTTSALEIPRGVRYAIYTDRLGKEGVALDHQLHRSRATSGWLEREHRFVVGAEKLFVMGPSSRASAIADYGVFADNVHVIGGAPNAVLGPPRESTACRQLLFVGLDWRRKGLTELMQAFEALAASHPDLRLDVVGGTPDVPAPAGVHLAGRVPAAEMSSYFARADALVIPTHVEAFGIALVEALMMGIPVIGTTVGNQQWIIGDGGLITQPGDVDGLTEALQTLIAEYPAWKSKAEARREVLLNTMTWDHIGDRILQEFPTG